MTIEGKTKIISSATVGLVTSKDDITAGDGAKHDILRGKARLATSTTCTIFELLRQHHIPLAYIGRSSKPNGFYTELCTMIPVEVVVRRVATGSYLKRHPHVENLTRFSDLKTEFFFKTSHRQLAGKELPCDDPLMLQHNDESWHLYRPDQPKEQGHIQPLEQTSETWTLPRCDEVAQKVFKILERAWHELGGELYDFKVEFGINAHGNIVVADVIDCDSWRVMWHGAQLSKQGYREGDNLEEVLYVYRMAETLVKNMT